MNRNQRRLQKQIQKHMEEEQKKQQEKQIQEHNRIMRLVAAVEEAGSEWTIVMSAKDKQTVEKIIREQEEYHRDWLEQYERDHDDDDDDHDDFCRNCGCQGTFFEGCCSVRCAKDADQYY
jgi:hypothetical protein